MRVLVVLGHERRRRRQPRPRPRRVADRCGPPRRRRVPARGRRPLRPARASRPRVVPLERLRPPAPGPRRPGRARPRAGSPAGPTSCTRTGCGRPPLAVLADGTRRRARSSRRCTTPHRPARSPAPSTPRSNGSWRGAAPSCSASRPTSSSGCDRLGARRTGLAVVAAPPRRAAAPVTGTPCAPTSGVGGRTALAVVVARLAPQKGLDLLLDAHRELRGDDLDLVTVVAGDGPLRAPLQARIDAERPPRAPARAPRRRARPARRRRRRRVERGVGGPAGRHPGGPARGRRGRRHRRRRHRRPSSGTPPCSCPPADPVSLSRAIRDVVRARRGARRPALARRSSAPATCRPRTTRSRRPSRPTASRPPGGVARP